MPEVTKRSDRTLRPTIRARLLTRSLNEGIWRARCPAAGAQASSSPRVIVDRAFDPSALSRAIAVP